MPKHTNVIHDWWATVVRWLLMPFSRDFLVLPVKKSDTSFKYIIHGLIRDRKEIPNDI